MKICRTFSNMRYNNVLKQLNSLKVIILAVLFVATPFKGEACDECGANVFFDNLTRNMGKNTKNSFISPWALSHLSAPLVTAYLVNSDVDYKVTSYFRKNDNSAAYVPGVLIGTLAPLAVGGGLWLKGKADADIQNAAFAVWQTSLITLGYVSTLKVLSGRMSPHDGEGETLRSNSKKFDYLNGRIWDGWPSGHIAMTSAISATLVSYYPDNPKVFWGSVLATSYVFLSMIAVDRGGFHWFSDGVAGLMVGIPIGMTVGTDFRNGHKPLASKEKWIFSVSTSALVSPMPTVTYIF